MRKLAAVLLIIGMLVAPQQSLYSVGSLCSVEGAEMVTWSSFLDQVLSKLGSIVSALLSELHVDILASEKGTADVIDTGATSSPVTVLSPASGHRIDLRGIYLATNSTNGTVTAEFPTSSIIVGRIYCSKFSALALQPIHIPGTIDEDLQVSWAGTDNGAEIFYAVRYKEA